MVKKRILGFVILACFWFLSFGRSITTSLIWLDELGQSACYVQDWGTPQMNKSVLGTPLKVKGIVYKHGVGAHSISRMLLDLNAKALSVSGLAGADDNNLFAGHLQFKILGDRKILWRSRIMMKGDTPKKFNVSLSGIREVLFLVEECGDGIMSAQYRWRNVLIADSLSPQNDISAIVFAKNGGMWVGTWKGIYKFVDGKWISDGLENHYIQTLIIDRNDNLLAGTCVCSENRARRTC